MARNGSGTYVLPNTFTAGQTIAASTTNGNNNDIGAEITNSLALDGQSTMTGQLKGAAGTVSLPSYTFGVDPDSGMYRIGVNNIGLGVNGAKVLDIATTGLSVTGTLTASGALTGSSTANIVGDFSVNTSKFTVAAASGNTVVAGTLGVTGAATLSGLVDISGASSGQIKFPASQNASADVNTLDDYEEGTWTPVISAATVGDLSVSYSTQTGLYTKIGRLVLISFQVNTSAFSHTTSASDFRMTGLPFATTGTINISGSLWFSGITKANYTQFVPVAVAGQSYMTILASGQAQSGLTLAITDFPSGGSVVLWGSVAYLV